MKGIVIVTVGICANRLAELPEQKTRNQRNCLSLRRYTVSRNMHFSTGSRIEQVSAAARRHDFGRTGLAGLKQVVTGFVSTNGQDGTLLKVQLPYLRNIPRCAGCCKRETPPG